MIYRRIVSRYLVVASMIALARVMLYLWLLHKYVTHTVSDSVLRLGWLEYPEEFVALHTGVGTIGSKAVFVSVFAFMLTVGSFVFSSPLLFIGLGRTQSRSLN